MSVGGSVVAVLYADGPAADKSEEPYWPAFLDVLARHAGRVLEAITVRQAAGLMTGKATGLRILVGQPSVLGEHSVKRVIFILACAVVAFHGLGAQQTIDDTRAREAAAVQLTATRHAPLPPNVSQYWFVQDVPGASAGERRASATALSRFAKGVRAVASEDFAAGFSLLNGLDLGDDAACRLRAVLHRGCARGSRRDSPKRTRCSPR